MLADDLFADPEAETCAGGIFGGEEGLEDVSEGFRGDAAACVADGNADAGYAACPLGPDYGGRSRGWCRGCSGDPAGCGFGGPDGADEPGSVGANDEAAAVGGHGVESVPDEVGEELA